MAGRWRGVGMGKEFSRFGVGMASLSGDVGFCRATLNLRRSRHGRTSSNSFILICVTSSRDGFLLRLA